MMEIALAHTTGSPSRHDSDSDPSYDRKRQSKSSSEMALHRKQSRRSKKQMSERQRRKRMNNSMDKLGLLVYGKTFQDGLKVDKATLLKDAYEKLQTMKDDYHKGYETAISSTQSFLDRLDGCPQEVKEALNSHLKNTLQINLQRCRSTTTTTTTAFPAAGGESSSDSCSPQPLRSASLEVIAPGTDYPFDSCTAPSHESSLQSSRRILKADSRRFHMTAASCGSSQREPRSLAMTEFGPKLSDSYAHHPVALADGAQVSSPSRTVVQVAPLPAQRKSVGAEAPRKVDCGDSPNPLPTSSPSSSHASCTSTSTSASISVSTPRHHTAWNFRDTHPGDSTHPLRKDLHLMSGLGSYPQQTTYPGFVYPTSTTAKISPYVTPYAPQDPIYLGSTPSGLIQGVPDIVYSGSRLATTPPYPALHPLSAHTPARFGGPTRADDSGYISPGVPTPQTLAGAGYSSSSAKRRYASEVEMRRAAKAGQLEDTDEENDKEVEQVFSRRKRYESSDSGTSHSD